jgi:fluoride exporter
MPVWLLHSCLVFLGGGVGSLARFAVGLAVPRSSAERFPLATLTVNLLGCFAIGLILAYLKARNAPPAWHFALVLGVLGGFTTFSSFGYETFDLIRRNQLGVAVSYVLLSNALGLLLVWLGHRTGVAAFTG